MLGEHFTSGFVDVERIGNNSFSGSTRAFSGDAKTIISVLTQIGHGDAVSLEKIIHESKLKVQRVSRKYRAVPR